MPIRLWLLASLVWVGPAFAGATPKPEDIPEVTPGKEIVLSDQQPAGKAVGWVQVIQDDAVLVIHLEEMTGVEKVTVEKGSNLLKNLKPGGTLEIHVFIHPTSERGGICDAREIAIFKQIALGSRVEVQWYRPERAAKHFFAASLKLLQSCPQSGTFTGIVRGYVCKEGFDMELTGVPAGCEHLVGQRLRFQVPIVGEQGKRHPSPSHLLLVKTVKENNILEVGYKAPGYAFVIDTIKVVGQAAPGSRPPPPPPKPTPPKPPVDGGPKPPPPAPKPPPAPTQPKPPGGDDDF